MKGKITESIRKNLKLPAGVLFKKALRKSRETASGLLFRAIALFSRGELSDAAFLRSFQDKYGFRGVKDIAGYFRNRKGPSFFVFPRHAGPSGVPAERIIDLADRVCSHRFSLLGSGEVDLGEEINWHSDFKTGYRWQQNRYFRDIKITYGKADIKIPRELSRSQHLIALGEAFRLTKNEKYAKEFTDEIGDWISNNRQKFGVNWHCTMDVAIRAANWAAGFLFFTDSPSLSDDFILRFLKAIPGHAYHIMNHPEYSEDHTSNHYLSGIAGLVFLGILFPEFKGSEKWRESGVRELKKEMFRQVYPDGCDFEGSTSYHRLVLELFFYCSLLVVVNDPGFDGKNYEITLKSSLGAEFTERLRGMFDAALHLLKPNGRMPQIGDNDSGQFFKLFPREVLDMRYLLSLGAVFFKEPRWKVREFFISEEDLAELLIVYGRKGKEIWDALEFNSISNIGSRAFPDTGWYVMRSNGNYCIISCGPNGQNGNGGHCHNDKLSFELFSDGKDAVMDPGTYVYTPMPEWRNKFRGTGYHNTVTVNGEEQNRFNPGNLFFMENDAHPKCLKFEAGEKKDFFSGEHYGWERLPEKVVHQREIIFNKESAVLEITDRLAGEGEVSMEWNFILPPGSGRGDIGIFLETAEFEEYPAFYSKEYGAIEETRKMTCGLKAKLPFELKYRIQRGPG